METHAQDAIFIVWAYAGAALVLLGLIATLWWQSRSVRARLNGLEAQGIRRRSAGTTN
jgi:heme exporter protein CcmD